MKSTLNFTEFWEKFHDRSLDERERYFTSLRPTEQKKLVESFFAEGWPELFFHNIVDDNLDFIKETYSIDLIDMRIKILRDNRVFLIEKKVFEHIKELIDPYEDYYNNFILWGGLKITKWGRRNQFYKISKEN